MTSPSAIVFGLDGAPLDLVRGWGDSLPNLRALMDSGASGTLRSTLPATTPVAWPSIYTGANPGRHGAFGFHRRRAGTYEWTKTTSADIRLPLLWELLGDATMRSAVLFAPYTFPMRPLNGIGISGRGSPRRVDARLTHPSSLASELASEFGEDALFGPRMGGATLRETIERLVRTVELQTEVALRALEREAYDFVFVVWDQTDTAAHLFWHVDHGAVPDHGSPLHRIYVAVDKSIGRILEKVGGDPLVIACSDHGTEPTRYRVRIPLWLDQVGLMKIARSTKSPLQRGARAWRKLPAGLRRLVPERTRYRVATSLQPSGDAVDWAHTTVYPQPVSAEALYLNLLGREPRGTVEPAQRVEALLRVSGALAELETPDGERVVSEVLENANLYEGRLAVEGPDAVVETAPYVMFAHAFLGDTEVFHTPASPDLDSKEQRPVAYHKRDGMFVIAGPKVTSRDDLHAHVADIAPTVLRHLGAPYPNHMDGVAIEGAFEQLAAPRRVDRPLGESLSATGLTEEEEAAVDEHLRELGYIE